LNYLEIADGVLADIRSKNILDARNKIKWLIDQNVPLEAKWGAITRLALSIEAIDLCLQCANNYLAFNKGNVKTQLQVAGIYAEAGKIKQAIEQVKGIDGEKHPQLFHFLGTAYSQIGEIDKAQFYLNEMLKKYPHSANSWLSLSAVKKYTKQDASFILLLSQEKYFFSVKSTQNAPYWFALGKALLDTEQPIQAYNKISIGCQLLTQSSNFNRIAYQTKINSIIATQSREFLQNIPKLEVNGQRKIIFIIGLPRSGTTLLQQILSTHSKINPGGESNALPLSFININNPQVLSDLLKGSHSELKIIRQQYMDMLQQRFGQNDFVVDKSLSINHYLGLLKKMFPQASFIKIHRNKKETAWSCYRTFFNQGLHWSYDLDDIKYYFDYEEKLFNHWLNIFDDILEINYEDLIRKPNKTIEQCLMSIGLDFEDDLLNFYTKKHLVQTASVGQVRKPINTKSLKIAPELDQFFTMFL
jgi:tetratricopeptide (TPR) repeat protein